MKELHLTKKDFRIDWYSGSGAGGQHRNKHQNCCRITHVETGIMSVGTGSKERNINQKEAFNKLAKRIIAHLMPKVERSINTDVIWTYNEYKNFVKDKASGFRQPYKKVMDDLGLMIDARRNALQIK